MSTDFWAGYVSGVVGIVVGNPLDLIKVQLQARGSTTATGNAFKTLTTGTGAPILGYGALNALLFVSYNRSEAILRNTLPPDQALLSSWLAGAIGGLAIWIVSTPTEIVKCRAQISPNSGSSSAIARHILKHEGIRGFYFGGLVTALRDSIGYGFYFWAYELAVRSWPSAADGQNSFLSYESPKALLCGGMAGVATWASVFPLDVIKTRVQTQPWLTQSNTLPLLGGSQQQMTKPRGAWRITRDIYQKDGIRVFFRGLTVCCARAFIVNAVQWAVYEWAMREWKQPSH